MPLRVHHALSMHVDGSSVDVKHSDSSLRRELNEGSHHADSMIGEVHNSPLLSLHRRVILVIIGIGGSNSYDEVP
jgi:hypothetical protein